MPHEDSKKLFQGAFILTIAAAITKILSAVYRVPFQNIVGDIGFYIYQQIYPFYGVAIALATYGFPVIISKIVAESEASKEKIDVEHILKNLFFLLSILGIFLFLIIFLGAPFLADMMGDPKLKPLIKMISFSFLLIPFISAIRGFFQGKGNMLPTAVSQVLEQLVRVVSILIITYYLIKNGYSLYDAGQGALVGSIAGGVVSLFVLMIFLVHYKNKASMKVGTSKGNIGKTFILQGLAICISGMLLVLFQLVDSLNIFALLTKSGVSLESAKKLKGIYDRGQPLLQLGTIVATSFSLTLVPIISSAYKEGVQSELKEKVLIAIKISIIVGAGATVGLINIIQPTNMMLFKNTEGSLVLAVFSISILFTSVILTVTGIMQGVGRVYIPAIYMLIAVVLKFFLNQWLVPTFGTLGASYSTDLTLGILTILFISKLYVLKLGKLPLLFYSKVFVSLLIMTVTLQIWMRLWENLIVLQRSSSIFYALSGVAVGGISYLISIVGLKLFDKDELAFIPFASKLQKYIRMKNDS